MNVQVEYIWRILQIYAQSIMMHTQVLDEYINFALMYTTHHILPVLPIKHLLNQDAGPPTTHKMETGTKHSVSNICVQFFPRVVQKLTSHVDVKVLNMRHQPKSVLWSP